MTEKEILENVKNELKKLIDESKRYDGGQKFVLAYRNVLAMIKYAEEDKLDELYIDNCLHRKSYAIYAEI